MKARFWVGFWTHLVFMILIMFTGFELGLHPIFTLVLGILFHVFCMNKWFVNGPIKGSCACTTHSYKHH